MSDYENPYQSPETTVVPEQAQGSGVELTVNMLQSLNEASPWLRFIGIMGFVGAGIVALTGIIGAITMSAAGSFFDGIAGGMMGLIFLIIPISLIIYFPAYYTFKFGQKIRNHKFTNSIDDLEEAFKNNKSLWKFKGILFIIYLALFPAFIVGAIVVGIVSAFGLF